MTSAAWALSSARSGARATCRRCDRHRCRRAASDTDQRLTAPAQVVPDMPKVDAEHEALCREAILHAREQAGEVDGREVRNIL